MCFFLSKEKKSIYDFGIGTIFVQKTFFYKKVEV